MIIIYSIILISVGLVMIISPKKYYDITQGWKNNSDTKPSSEYITLVRIGGSIFLIAGVIALIYTMLG